MVHCSLFYILVTKQYHATLCLCALDMILLLFVTELFLGMNVGMR